MATGVTVLGLYLHITHLVDKEEGKIPQPFKGTKLKRTRGRGKPKGKPQEQRQNPPKAQEADEIIHMIAHKSYFQGNQTNSYRGRSHGQGPQQFRGHGHGRANYQSSNGMYQYQYYMHDPQTEQYGPPCS